MKLFFLFLFFVLCHVILSTFLRERKKIFDKFFYHELYSQYIEQYHKKQCDMTQGPDCFMTDSYFYQNEADFEEQIFNDYLNISTELYSLDSIENLTLDDKKDTTKNSLFDYPNQYTLPLHSILNDIKNHYTEEIEAFYSLNANSPSTYKKPSSISYSLFLTFESYDQETRTHDIYMPQEKAVQFYYSTLIMTFIGSLRLRYASESLNILNDGGNYPSKTYGIIESNELFIKFNKEVTCTFFYLRNQNKGNNQNKRDMIEAYLNEHIIYSSTLPMTSSKTWMQFNFPNIKFNKIRFPGGIEIDNLLFVHETYNQFNVEVHFNNLNLLNKKNELIKENDIY